jgi:hypothetical protein
MIYINTLKWRFQSKGFYYERNIRRYLNPIRREWIMAKIYGQQ